MSPVDVEKDKPAGRELGEMEYEFTFPPELEIEYKLTALSTLAVAELELNVMLGASTGWAHTMVRGVSLFGVCVGKVMVPVEPSDVFAHF